jgi:hypothetical protein
MDMSMSSIRPNRVEVVTSVQRRRRWTPVQKLEIVKQTNEPGSSVSLVCACGVGKCPKEDSKRPTKGRKVREMVESEERDFIW